MSRLIILVGIILCLAIPVSAEEYTMPAVPDAAQDLMPVETTSFGKDLWKIIQEATQRLHPELVKAAGLCVSVFAIVLLLSIMQTMPGVTESVVRLVAALSAAVILLHQTGSLIDTASDTIYELSEYGKQLIPVMAAAMASQGGITSSTALYAGTAVFNAILSSAIKLALIPMVYVFLVLSIASCATGQSTLDKLRDFVKWLIVWILKIILYVFTGYIGITGVVSGSADAATLKAAKLTISGMIPVVGNILSDASEAVLVGAGVMKSAVGIYGVLTLIALWISPFLRIGIRYLLLKLTAAVSQLFGSKEITDMIGAFCEAMGLLLAMTGGVSVMLLISTVCFMKGVG